MRPAAPTARPRPAKSTPPIRIGVWSRPAAAVLVHLGPVRAVVEDDHHRSARDPGEALQVGQRHQRSPVAGGEHDRRIRPGPGRADRAGQAEPDRLIRGADHDQPVRRRHPPIARRPLEEVAAVGDHGPVDREDPVQPLRPPGADRAARPASGRPPSARPGT